MTNHSDSHDRPSLDADDPRISEWIDGRLSAAEAAEVERAVRASAALSRLVADLRAIKEAARLVLAASPPPGFVERVMDAVGSPPRAAEGSVDAEADRAVAREWQSVETERLAEERAEARADLADAAGARIASAHPGTKRAWPWLAIGAALAAGLLVAVVLNPPKEGPREIARVMPQPAADKVVATERSAAAPAVETATPPLVAAPAAAGALRRAVEEKGDASAAAAPGAPVEPAAIAARPPQAQRARAADELLDQARLGAAAAPVAEREVAGDGGQPSEADAAADPAAMDRARDTALPQDRPVVVTVGSWTEFDRLLEANGVEAKPVDTQAGEARAEKSGTWTLELTGPPAGLEALLAATGVTKPMDRGVAAREQAKQAAEGRQDGLARKRGGPLPGHTLVVRLVIQDPVGQKAPEPARANEVPGAGDGGGP